MLLCERGLATSRERARALIMAGRVLVEARKIDKPGTAVDPAAAIRLLGDDLPFVSRGGLKLDHALATFGLDVAGKIALDVGASTGGFSDCLLQRGAARVYAVDVGYGQLAEKLRTDPRVVNLERTNIRTLAALPEAVDLIVIDASFISLKLVLPSALRFAKPGGDVVALIKPQFEVGKNNVGKGGVVKDATLHARVIDEVSETCQALGLTVRGTTRSPITGHKSGNVEFLIWAHDVR